MQLHWCAARIAIPTQLHAALLYRSYDGAFRIRAGLVHCYCMEPVEDPASML